MRLPGVLWMAPIDALEQHRQLRRAQMHRAALRLWPHEATSFETLLVKIHPVPAPPQEFDQITSAPTEHEHVSRKRILLQRGLYLRGQRVHAAAHVAHPGRQPHARSTG